MKLKMYIGDTLVASVAMHPSKMKQQDFIEDLVRSLKEKHVHEIEKNSKPVVFFIDNVPSSMNRKD